MAELGPEDVEYYEDVPRMEAIRDRLALQYLRGPSDELREQIWVIDLALRLSRERTVPDPEVYQEMIWELVQAGILFEKITVTDYTVGGPNFTKEHFIKKSRRYVTEWEDISE